MVTSPRSQDLVHYLRLVLLAVAVIGLGYVLFVAIANYTVLTRRPCPNQAEPLGVPWSGYFIFGSLGAFCLGALIGYWRHASGLGADVPVERDWSAVAVQVVLTVFFVLGVVLLVYEMWAEWDPLVRWPITSFVRCADRNQTIPSLATAGAVSFLLGQWLWRAWEAADA